MVFKESAKIVERLYVNLSCNSIYKNMKLKFRTIRLLSSIVGATDDIWIESDFATRQQF